MLAWMDKKEQHVDKDEKKINFKFKEIFKFSFEFWLICTVCVLFYATIFPYIGSVQSFYMFKYGLSNYSANICNRYIIKTSRTG